MGATIATLLLAGGTAGLVGAGASGALTPDIPDVDLPEEPNLDEQRARRNQRRPPGIASNILSQGNQLGGGSGGGVASATVGKRTLGGAV